MEFKCLGSTEDAKMQFWLADKATLVTFLVTDLCVGPITKIHAQGREI